MINQLKYQKARVFAIAAATKPERFASYHIIASNARKTAPKYHRGTFYPNISSRA